MRSLVSGKHSWRLRSAIVFACGTLAFICPIIGHSQTDTGATGANGGNAANATRVIAEARAAMGGEAKIAAIKTIVVTGRTRQVRGDNLIPIEFEIQAELPDKYSRRDEFPAQDTGPTTSGFNGDRAVQIPAPLPPVARAGGPPPPTAQQLELAARGRVVAAKQDFARLMLGLFASSYPSHPLTFAYVGQAEAPQGKADVVDVKGPADFAARLFISAETHLPIMLSWQARPAPVPGRGRGPGGPGPAAQPPVAAAAPPAAAAPAASPAPARGAGDGSAPAPAPAGGAPPGAARAGGPSVPPPVENRLYFAEYRSFDGLQLPTRVRRSVAGDTTEETTFDRFRINARVDPRRFDPGH